MTEKTVLVATYDYKGLATKMNQLAGNSNLRKSFGEKSREISLKHDKPKVLHKLEVIFDKRGKSRFPGRPGRIFDSGFVTTFAGFAFISVS